ncbi:MAG TPA: MFS transporter, partial [Anaerolineales bacterium]|nr:MFS transporter [Anaerolineales bacterium]
MHKIRKFVTFLNIQPGEERLIGLLILLYFILALGFVFVQSMTFGIFLAEYGVGGLPYSYMVIAILASSVAVFYIRLGGRVSFSKLLFINLIFLASASLLLWVALSSPLYHVTAFILPLWFQIAINLGNLAVWPLAGSLFDFRQGKRLFPLLAAGNWLANIIGGLFIPALVKSIGTTNLLLLGGLSFGAGLFILRMIIRSYVRTPAEKPKTQRVTPQAKSSTGIFKDRYVLLIFAYTILWWVAFFFVDNIFYNRAFAQYPDADQLAAFLGRLISMMGIVALLSSTVVSGRVITRLGLRAGMLAMPLAVILSLGLLALSGTLGASLFFVFALSAFAKLINVAFGFSLSQSANAIVYQSLPDTVRGRVQATA